MLHQPLDGGKEVVHELFRIDRLLQFTTLVIVARIAADRGQPVRRQRNETGFGNAARHVFDVRVQAAILMCDNHCRYFFGRFGRTYQIAANLTMPLGRRVGNILGNNVRVGKFHLFGQRVVGAQRGKQRAGGEAAKGEQRCTIEKLAPVDPAVCVVVIKLKQFRRKVFCSKTFHRYASFRIIQGGLHLGGLTSNT